MPKVSVVLPTYNSEQYLTEAIDSILAQSFSDFELIVVDSNSNDRTLEILQAYDDTRINLLAVPCKCGEAIPRNLGYMSAKGEFIANMDSDDLMHKDRLLKQVSFLEANLKVDVLGSNFTLFNGERRSKRKQPSADGAIKAKMLFANGNAMMNPTVMLRRAFVAASGVYYPQLSADADHGFWLECIKNDATFANLEDNLLDYRIHKNNMSKAASSQKTALRSQFLALYLSSLSHKECGNISLVMEEGRSLSLVEADTGVLSIDRALQLSTSDYGVDAKLLKNVLLHIRSKVVTQINIARGLESSL